MSTGDGGEGWEARWVLRRGSPAYPAGLEDLADRAPKVLYGIGDRGLVSDLDPDLAATIVGARRASAYGVEVAEQLGRMLGGAGITVVSGMARGTDAAAHRGALAGDGATVAVLAGGPDVAYPASQRGLHRRILTSGGAVISERRPGVRPEPWAFPERNRIMAALARITIVVEARERSGTRITADWALAMQRAVAAVPGPVTSALSAGPNQLLYEGADLVRDAQDVLDRLVGVGAPRIRDVGPPLDAIAEQVLEAVEAGHATCDAVAGEEGLSGHACGVALGRLELLGYVRSGPGGRFARTALRRGSIGSSGGDAAD